MTKNLDKNSNRSLRRHAARLEGAVKNVGIKKQKKGKTRRSVHSS